MLDYGLIFPLALVVGVPWLWSRHRDEPEVSDSLSGPIMAGLVAARLGHLAIENRSSLVRPFELLIFRSGMEFWVGVAAAAAMMRRPVFLPYLLAGYATYEATCISRGVCFGPASAVGLRPSGFVNPVFPVGLVVAALVAAGAVWLIRSGLPPWTRLAAALAIVAVPRSVASFWLPKLGDGLTRPHLVSLAVAAASLLALVILRGRSSVSSRFS